MSDGAVVVPGGVVAANKRAQGERRSPGPVRPPELTQAAMMLASVLSLAASVVTVAVLGLAMPVSEARVGMVTALARTRPAFETSAWVAAPPKRCRAWW